MRTGLLDSQLEEGATRENLFLEPVRGINIIKPVTRTPPTIPIEAIKGSRLPSKL